jgi:hypothetical protein
MRILFILSTFSEGNNKERVFDTVALLHKAYFANEFR